jgi:predicted N-formylglutamate amidohydrolase
MHRDVKKESRSLLEPDLDPHPVEVINGDSMHQMLLVCEHAGRKLPVGLVRLGLPPEVMDMHIAYDIGAEKTARKLADKFGCTLVLQQYSRLVIDCNRPPGTTSAIPTVSDGVPVPGNQVLNDEDTAQRVDEIFAPMAERCIDAIQRPHISCAVSIHSFTKQLSGQNLRPWDIGFLYRQKQSRGAELTQLCKQFWPDLTVGDNEPYGISDDSDWFIPSCAEPRGIPHALIEIRNDKIDTEAGQNFWADRLHQLLTEFMDRNDV